MFDTTFANAARESVDPMIKGQCMRERRTYYGGKIKWEHWVRSDERIEKPCDDCPVFDVMRIPGEHPTQCKIGLHPALNQECVHLTNEHVRACEAGCTAYLFVVYGN